METSIAGRVKNMPGMLGKPLVPLFEAIGNSIDAIQEAKENGGLKDNGNIDIEIIRDEGSIFYKSDTGGDRQLADITGFYIRDNGIGFNDRNYRHFNIADTTYKAKRGGKGVGRFTWLKTFKKVDVESIFIENGQYKRRTFTFSLTNETGIETHDCVVIPNGPIGTSVHLVDFKREYRQRCRRRVDVIAAYIVEEFLDAFIGPLRPKILLHDRLMGDDIDLDDFFNSVMLKSYPESVEIKGYLFDLIHVQLHSTHIYEHRIHYCAKDRSVKPERLVGVPNLPSRLHANDGQEFIYAVYVSSSILDDLANSDRMGFDLPEDNVPLLADELSFSDIRSVVKERSIQYLRRYTEPLKKKKRERIERFTETDGLMYKPILRRLEDTEDAFDDIEIEASDADIDLKLYKEYQKLQLESKRQGQALLEAANSEYSDYKAFEERLSNHFKQIAELKQSDLARYVVQRKAVIEFLRKLLARQSDGSYSREEKIHNLICQRNVSSNNILFYDHNLWLVDERLAFYVYLSSDKQIKTVPLLESDSTKEPDVLIFDKAIAFADSPHSPFSSITIIEFKRPLRTEYSEKENPFSQVADYIDDIKKGKAKYKDGRAMPMNPNIPFYSYIICDLTPQLERWAKMYGLTRAADGLGWFGYMPNYSTYVEVISYDKLLVDAEKRHIAFFEKLGISTKPSI